MLNRSWLRTLGPLVLVSAVALVVTSPANAQAPAVTSISPGALTPGGTTDITVRGSGLNGATALWTSFPATAVLSPDVDKNGTAPASTVYRVTVPENVACGVHAVRAVTDHGTSSLQLMLVDDLPSVAQQGSNTTALTAQEVTLPVAIDGAVPNLSRHCYRFHATAGQRVSFEVLARRLGTALDPVIRLLTAEGRELTYSDDAPGLSGDSQLAWTFSEEGDYVLEIRDIRYQGGGNHRYRLRMGDFPCVNVPWPMQAQRGTQASISFAGSSVEEVQPVDVAVPSEPTVEWMNVSGRRSGGASSGFAVLSVTDAPVAIEQEPNDKPTEATRVEPGAGLNGRFEQPGDVDHWIFAGKKGQQLTFRSITRRQGSPCDLYLRMLNDKGAQLAVAEDSGTLDAELTYSFPADGDYILAVDDLHRHSGSAYAYSIQVLEPEKGFRLDASADVLNIPAGGTAHCTVTAVRKGYNGPIELAVEGAPEGSMAHTVVIGPGQTTAVLTATVPADAETGKYIPLKIVGKGTAGSTTYTSTATVDAAIKAGNSGMPFVPLPLSEELALGVAPAPPFTLRTEPAVLVFGQSLSNTVKVIVTRTEGYDEAITLAVEPAKTGLPAAVTAAVKPIPKGAGEIDVTFTATDKSPLGQFSAVLLATAKKGNVTTVQAVPAFGLTLEAPFSLTADPGTDPLTQGGELKLKVALKRNPAFDGPVTLTVQNLPKGVTAAATEIPKDATEAEITLTAAADAAVGEVKNLVVKADGKAGKAALTANAPPAALKVAEKAAEPKKAEPADSEAEKK